MSALLRGFPPIARPDARVLVLGSMPGVASLVAGEYYAHRRNAFWPLMGILLDAGPERSYAERMERLCAVGVAVWDVLAGCERSGSADSAIVPSSERANDFGSFFVAHPCIAQVFFNGAKAESAWKRQVAGELATRHARIPCTRLPSTSAAHAGLDQAQKLEAWRVLAHSAVAGSSSA